jgi:ABC-type polysaccharide/polyol phosphate transport system ATPase subunit
MTQPVLIRAENVSKRFSRSVRHTVWNTFQDIAQQLTGAAIAPKLRPGEFWALQDISFKVRKAESVAVIGDNGAGKSTLIKLLMRRMLPTSGIVETTGAISALTVLGLGFDPVMSGRENIILNAATLGLSRSQTLKVLDDIIDFAELREFIDTPIQTYSSGMKSRLGYAVAAHVNPDVLLLDEVLAVGDIRFRRKCRRHIKNFIDAGGTTLLVTHDLQAVQTICTRCLVLEKGRLVFDGSPTEGIHFYLESQLDASEDDPHGAEKLRVPALPIPLLPDDPPKVPAVEPIREVPISEAVDLPTEIRTEIPNDSTFESTSTPDEPEVEPLIAEPTADDRPETDLVAVSAEPLPFPDEDLPSEEDQLARPDPEPVMVEEEIPGMAKGSVVIESLSIEALDGKHLRTAHPVELVMRYRSEIRIPHVAWGFSIVTEDSLVSIGTFIEGYSARKYDLLPGRHTFRIRVERFPLHAGRYGLRAGIGEVDTGAAIVQKGWEDEPIIFTVRSDPSPENSMHAGMNDLIVLEGQPSAD